MTQLDLDDQRSIAAAEEVWRRRAQRLDLDYDTMTDVERQGKLFSLYETDDFKEVFTMIKARHEKIKPHVEEAERKSYERAIGELCELFDEVHIQSQQVTDSQADVMNESGVLDIETQEEDTVEVLDMANTAAYQSKIKMKASNTKQVDVCDAIDNSNDDDNHKIELMSSSTNVHMRGSQNDTEFTLKSSNSRKSVFAVKKKMK